VEAPSANVDGDLKENAVDVDKIVELDKIAELGATVQTSGLWASYGDAANAAGAGRGARAISNVDWDVPGRFARATGAPDPIEGERSEEKTAFDAENARIDAVFGYDRKPWSKELRLTVAQLRMLLGEEPSDAALRLRIWSRLDVAEKRGTRADVQALRDLVARLQ
jgi:hypothetical protein